MSKGKETQINFYTNILSLFVNVIIGIYYTPYLVNKLGIAVYGILPLALLINQYIGVVTNSLTNAITRFYSYYIRRMEYKRASESLSSAFAIILLFIIFLLPFISIFIHNINIVFNIPEELIESAKLLFVFTVFSFFISLLTSLLNVVLYSLNRLDLMNHIRNIKIILKLVFVILFFTVIEIEIVYVGLSNLAAECIALLISIPFFIKHKHKNVALNIKNCSKAAFNDLGSMVAWTIIQVLGDVGLYRVENIIINKQWGITESGTLGTITEFCGYVMTIVSTIGSIFGPLILIAYSANNRDEVKRMALNQSYMVGSLAAIIAGTIAGHSVQIMRYWLGETFVQYGNWLIIKMASISFYASGSIFWFVFRAWNKIKIPALANLFLGFCNVSALIILSTWRNKSIELLLIVSSIFMIIQSYLFSGYYLNKIYKKTFLPILLSAVKMGVIFSGCLLLSISVQKIFIIAGVLKLAGSLIISCLIGLAIVYMFFYNRIIKKQFLNILGLSQDGSK